MKTKGFLNKYTILGLILIIMSVYVKTEIQGSSFLEGDCFKPVLEKYVYKNTSSEKKTFVLQTEGEASPWMNANGKFTAKEQVLFTLNPNETKEIYTFTKPFCNVFSGKYFLTMKIKSTDNKVRETKKITFNVLESRDLSIKPVKKILVTTKCSETKTDITIKNNSKANEVILIKVFGLPEKWYKLSDTEFLLDKNKTKKIELKVTPECTASGKKDFNVLARIKGTEFFVFSPMETRIKNTQIIKISGKQTDFNACSETSETKTIEIENLGEKTDKIQFSTDYNKIRIEPETITLNGKSTAKVNLLIEKNPLMQNNKKTVKIKAKSLVFGNTFEKTIRIFFEDCYNLKELTDKNLENQAKTYCIEEPLTKTVSFINTGKKTVNGTTSIKGLKGKITPEKFSLQPGKKIDLKIIANLKDANNNTNSFELNITSKNLVLTKKIGFETEKCYSLQFSTSGFANKIVIPAGKEKVFTISLKNTGTKKQTASISVKAPFWVYFQPEKLELSPGTQKQFYVYLAPPIDAKDENKKISISVSGKYFFKKFDSNISTKNTLLKKTEKVDLNTLAKATQTSIKKEKIVLIEFALKNPLTERIKINKIEIVGYNTLQPSNLYLDANEEKTISTKISLGQATEKKIELELKIFTNKGVINKKVLVEVINSNNEEPPIKSALATSTVAIKGNNTNALIFFLFAVIIALFAYIGYIKKDNPDKKQTEKEPEILKKA